MSAGHLPLFAAALALALAGAGELLHARRVRRLALLAFGPSRRPALWARAAPPLRVAASVALAWGLATLLVLEPRRYASGEGARLEDSEKRHVLLVLDVSPSMRLVDAGPDQQQSRMQRARELMESFFARVPAASYAVTVVATYNGALPVVEQTSDLEVVRNILGDLPLHHAFRSGPTRLLDGLQEAARIARPWNPGSATLLVVSDGDTVPASGMPAMPASVSSVLVVGVGDPLAGKQIDGRQSRQDASALSQIAARLGGSYHDGNARHLRTSLVAGAFELDRERPFERLTRREYALLACAAGALALALLPLLLQAFGTKWRPGTSKRPPGAGAGPPATRRAGRDTMVARTAAPAGAEGGPR